MSLVHSPSIATSSLAFYYDMYNPKSFVGAPSTNLLTYSNQFEMWSKSNVTVVANAGVAPDGTMTADSISNTVSVSSFFYPEAGSTAYVVSNVYTRSIYAKAGIGTGIIVFEWLASGSGTFNLQTGAASGTGASMIPVGNGWYRCMCTTTYTGTGAGNAWYVGAYGSTAIPTTVYLWGAQVEISPFATPLVTTTAAPASRTVPLKDMIGANTITAPSLTYAANNIFTFNGTTDYISIADSTSLEPAAITVCVWAQATSVASYQVLAAKGDVSTYGWELANSTGITRVTMRPDGVTNNVNGTALVANEKFHIAFSYDGTTLKLYKNGIQVGSVTSSTPVLNGTNRLLIGARAANLDASVVAGFTAGSVYSTAIYSRALTAAEVLQNFNATRSRYGL